MKKILDFFLMNRYFSFSLIAFLAGIWVCFYVSIAGIFVTVLAFVVLSGTDFGFGSYILYKEIMSEGKTAVELEKIYRNKTIFMYPCTREAYRYAYKQTRKKEKREAKK